MLRRYAESYQNVYSRIRVSWQFHMTQAKPWNCFCCHIVNTGITKKSVYPWSLIIYSVFPFSYLWGNLGYRRLQYLVCHKNIPTELYLNMDFSILLFIQVVQRWLKIQKPSVAITWGTQDTLCSGLYHSENSGKSKCNLTFKNFFCFYV